MILRNKGDELIKLERYKEAIAAYEKAIEIEPNYYQTWYNKGIALSDLVRYEEAIYAFDQALEIKPEFHEAW